MKTHMSLERGILFFEDGTEVSNVSVELIKAAPDMLKALKSAELSCVQAYLAHDIGKKTQAKQITFLLDSFSRLEKELREAIAKATGAQS
jgi:hypothetical protein